MSRALRMRYGRASGAASEIRRQGEIAGSRHAVGWIERNAPNLDELESAYVTAASSIEDVARRAGRERFGFHGAREGKRVEAFTAGYVDAWKKEIMREIGRQR